MTQEDILYTLALTKIDGIGDITAKKLINHLGNAKNVLESPKKQLQKIDGIGEILIEKIKKASTLKEAEQELKFIVSEQLKCFYYQNHDYPELLKQCIDAPVLLFGSGLLPFQDRKIISIVGTRNMTPYGRDMIRQLLEDIAPLDPLIVSGFAYGVDITAHSTALDLGLDTIGVLAHGLNQIYPKSHKKYISKVEAKGGFLTEFWSTSNPDKENFVKRNRIVAGMSHTTVVVESAEKGGSIITAYLANDYNREVFAVPGRITDKYSAGCLQLIKTQRALPITQAADIIYHLNWDLKPKTKAAIQPQLFLDLDPDEEKIINLLQSKGKELMDEIAITCDLPIFKVSSILLDLELKGLIRPLPGKWFEVV
jgi:DNA processing protein